MKWSKKDNHRSMENFVLLSIKQAENWVVVVIIIIIKSICHVFCWKYQDEMLGKKKWNNSCKNNKKWTLHWSIDFSYLLDKKKRKTNLWI